MAEKDAFDPPVYKDAFDPPAYNEPNPCVESDMYAASYGNPAKRIPEFRCRFSGAIAEVMEWQFAIESFMGPFVIEAFGTYTKHNSTWMQVRLVNRVFRPKQLSNLTRHFDKRNMNVWLPPTQAHRVVSEFHHALIL
jgi:hypothetical protein